MIIFDLDGTLADCEHRRHFVDYNRWIGKQNVGSVLSKWKPDWKAFYEACDLDLPIEPVIEILDGVFWNASCQGRFFDDVQIWSGRCESVREKTMKWLSIYALFDGLCNNLILKMRPIGDSTPDEQLKEKWLDGVIAEGKTIDFVFDDRPKVIRMWRKHGIFVFNCCQHDDEF